MPTNNDTVQYQKTSPYYNTPIIGGVLDLAAIPTIPKLAGDVVVEINKTYQYRPDLLAFDLYGDSRLWWVFYQRNPNTLTKPPLDFAANTVIYLPKITTLKSALGF